MLKTLALIILMSGFIMTSERTDTYPPPSENLTFEESTEIKLIAVRMSAEWCGYCKQLDPRVKELKSEFKGKQVLFTWFDQTDEFTSEQSAMLAELSGLSRIFEKYEGKTGVLLLIDPSTGEIVKEIDHTWEKDRIKREIESHLS